MKDVMMTSLKGIKGINIPSIDPMDNDSNYPPTQDSSHHQDEMTFFSAGIPTTKPTHLPRVHPGWYVGWCVHLHPH